MTLGLQHIWAHSLMSIIYIYYKYKVGIIFILYIVIIYLYDTVILCT